MKLILIAYNQGLDDRVMNTLRQCCLENYTKWTGVLGKGSSSGPHLASHVWPKANNVVAVSGEDDCIGHLVECVRGLRKELGHEGIKAFVLPLEDVS